MNEFVIRLRDPNMGRIHSYVGVFATMDLVRMWLEKRRFLHSTFLGPSFWTLENDVAFWSDADQKMVETIAVVAEVLSVSDIKETAVINNPNDSRFSF